MSSATVASQSKQTPPTVQLNKLKRPTVIGIYGISGSGKTFLLDQLKQMLTGTPFYFYEGSETIADLVPGGLEAFRQMDQTEKTQWRKRAIDTIRDQSARKGEVAVVTGHSMFWKEEYETGQTVWTENDRNAYTHILYLDVPVDTIEQRRRNDTSRSRPQASAAHLLKWQQAEKTQLQELCREHDILFSVLTSTASVKSRVLELLLDFSVHSKDHNEILVQKKVDATMASYKNPPETILVIDGDKTLAAQDTGKLFWEKVSETWSSFARDPLKPVFSGMGYSYTSFRQAMLLYEDAVDEKAYGEICEQVASEVRIQPALKSLLNLVAEQDRLGAVVVSCGLRLIWQKILDKEDLSSSMTVIAGGRLSDGYVVTADTKAAVVARLQTLYNAHVWAFGDSPLDLPMLEAADEAIVVVGDELTRSKSIEEDLQNMIYEGQLKARQAILPQTVSPRLDTSKLPLVDLNSIEFIGELLRRHSRSAQFSIHHATAKNAAKVIATQMRDAAIAGPALRKAHRQAGWYLAHEYLTEIIGVQSCPISHVLGHGATGSRLSGEEKTTIVAIMRAGEPMASGVSEAFPLAMYVHAKNAVDLMPHHIQGQSQIVLVDSVVNSGKTIIEFVQHIRDKDRRVPILIVTGVVQDQCVSTGSAFYQAMTACGLVSLVALRTSTTKFTGKGTTDTGNRLFGSTHIP